MLRRPRELWKRYCKSTWKSGRPGGGLDRTVSVWDARYRRGGKALRWQWRSVGMVKICSNLVLTHLLEPKMAASCLAAPKFRHITKHRWNYYPVQHQAQAWTIYHQMFTVSAIPTPTTGAAVNDWVGQASKCLTKRLITKLSIEYTSGHTLGKIYHIRPWRVIEVLKIVFWSLSSRNIFRSVCESDYWAVYLLRGDMAEVLSFSSPS